MKSTNARTFGKTISASNCGHVLAVVVAAEIRSAVLDPSAAVSHVLGEGRAAYLITTDGAVEIGGRRLEAGERLVARGPQTLECRAIEATELVLLDLPLVTDVVTG